MSRDTFDIIFLIARPAAGKSEIIDYLKRTDPQTRRASFHIGPFVELDDFPMLWTWFEEDRLLARMGHPRLHTDADEYFAHRYLWDLLVERLSLDYARLLRDRPDYHQDGGTVIVEFSRGREHGGFRQAFQHVAPEMLRRGAILYIDVSWEESLRKNRARANPNRPDSILQHSLSDEKLARLYRESDWAAFSAGDPERVVIQDISVPYAVFPNEDDVTTERGPALGQRLTDTLACLWRAYIAV
ncbi:MAG: hypothetical protein MUC51_08530 [Anaerolineae bacterium]|jgi:hypothetical protein|nr:hypothetical protein [Anaerolineae bacterium]